MAATYINEPPIVASSLWGKNLKKRALKGIEKGWSLRGRKDPVREGTSREVVGDSPTRFAPANLAPSSIGFNAYLEVHVQYARFMFGTNRYMLRTTRYMLDTARYMLGTSPSRFNLVQWHSLCSSQEGQDKPSDLELLNREKAHVDYIQRRATNTNTSLNSVGGSLYAQVPANIDTYLGISYYIVNIGLGTPAKSFSLMLDTGSDITWIQCIPCVHCYTQKNPFYNPTQSSTFTNIPCNTNYCTQLKRFGCSSNSTCLYETRYADFSSSNGSFIQDTLTFSSDTIHNFRFGCGHNNTGYFGQADGLLGLGRGVVSIISQTTQLYNNIFSYCLPSGTNRNGYLELGRYVPGVKYTPMLTFPNMPSFYFLKLIAISIGNARINLLPARTMLDSGTTFTYLPPSAYSILRSIFRTKMNKYSMAPPLYNLDTCYDLTGHSVVDVPEIGLIYDGEVTAFLDASGILYMTNLSQACFTFAANDDENEVTIIGNVQQRRFKIVYDMWNLKIGFGSNGCS
ncbi:aspartyl protease family protein At5g10770-like [Dendrobium catenatum]|uniref:aspartyl protease family protein At5g10770-like n=1 Tax=Dendrobium catenatum TaxID=906689 RepID=UPI00109F74B5|nr:aspartyl protease family protein At5g10770-like [Dendrobium catenatum]